VSDCVQTGVTQFVPATAGAHLPKPSQPAVQPAALIAHSASAPLGTALQLPTPLRLHRLHVVQDAVLQHTPSTQLPEPQSVLAPQDMPFGRAMQEPLLQIFPVPQPVPFATLPVELHTDAPVAHDVVPV
jgi:hypothetical protein